VSVLKRGETDIIKDKNIKEFKLFGISHGEDARLVRSVEISVSRTIFLNQNLFGNLSYDSEKKIEIYVVLCRVCVRLSI
jgi:hypothetical protein